MSQIDNGSILTKCHIKAVLSEGYGIVYLTYQSRSCGSIIIFAIKNAAIYENR